MKAQFERSSNGHLGFAQIAAIVASSANSASGNIMQRLLELFPFKAVGNHYSLQFRGNEVSLHSFGENLLFMDGIDKRIDADLFIIPYTHTSNAGIDCFTVHAAGNWGRADLGGKDSVICPVPAGLMKSAFGFLKQNSLGLEVYQEATHHGPFIGKPCMFIEIGSSDRLYRDEDAGRIVANAIMGAIGAEIPSKPAVGIGGLHYCQNFSKVMLNSPYSVGHVIPKHHLGLIDSEMIVNAAEMTYPKAEKVIVDWKGLGQFKEKVKRSIEESGLEMLKTSEF